MATILEDHELSLVIRITNFTGIDLHHLLGAKLDESLTCVCKFDEMDVVIIPFVQTWLVEKHWLVLVPEKGNLSPWNLQDGNCSMLNAQVLR